MYDGKAKLDTSSLIRQAAPNEMEKLKEIIDLSFPRFFRYFAIYSLTSEDGKVFVAETKGEVAGFAKLITFNVGAGKYGCILWIAVHPAHRRQGIALNLTNAGTNTLKKNGVQSVFASTQWRNNAAKATLTKADFDRMGFLSLWQVFGWRIFTFYREIWYAPSEIVYMHK